MIVHMLQQATQQTIPAIQVDAMKYWWDQELSTLKEESVAAHNAWKSAGKPNSGDLCEAKRVTKSRYRKSFGNTKPHRESNSIIIFMRLS